MWIIRFVLKLEVYEGPSLILLKQQPGPNSSMRWRDVLYVLVR